MDIATKDRLIQQARLARRSAMELRDRLAYRAKEDKQVLKTMMESIVGIDIVGLQFPVELLETLIQLEKILQQELTGLMAALQDPERISFRELPGPSTKK